MHAPFLTEVAHLNICANFCVNVPSAGSRVNANAIWLRDPPIHCQP